MKRICVAWCFLVVCCLLYGQENKSTELRYPALTKHLVIASPDNQGFPVTMSGAVPVVVNTYHTSSPTKEVSYSCLVDGKRLVNNKKLTQKSDWSWSDILYLTNRPYGKTITIRVKATYKNGEKIEKEMRFTYSNRKPLVRLDNEWTNLRGDAGHAGINETNLTPPLKMAWTSHIGANIFMVSPIVYQHKVFIASTDKELKGKGYIYALDSQTGNLQWKYQVENAIRNTIVAESGNIYAQTTQGSIIAIKASDGSLSWGRQLHVNGSTALVEGLVAANGIVYAGSGKGLCALDARSGDVIWENNAWEQGEGSYSTLTLGKGILVSSSQSQGLYGNDAETGELRWRIDRQEVADRGSTPALHKELLYLLSGHSLFIIQPETGNVIVRKEYPFNLNTLSAPLMTDKLIVFGSATEGLIAIDRETLEVAWKVITDPALIHTSHVGDPSSTVESSPVLSGHTIYFGASDGCLYGVNEENGEVVWKHTAGAPLFGSVAVSGNALFAVDFGGNVYAFIAE
ncbi:outer membrane protein assembly factor BamB [Parabacteroides sp. PFB2-10]|uniref:outer membrane protein assembly factor BamB family protein n=1 Tax=Parabacteroides sp. PFB2-10 TaxID=1742405 RepID=UPI00247628D4|nr:PQQ-binding-like beta-propeller repeat protein [Parabacteroides sp. PFB2-10]MDH6312014.1 outer membrane protein assembly factor BamB [Parabacteroides sp. PFB2-10]MDL2244162.1 PQQ-binding-like beta-propeller repeat protein [Parabacteroides sp. OttesenSCG-928-J18]